MADTQMLGYTGIQTNTHPINQPSDKLRDAYNIQLNSEDGNIYTISNRKSSRKLGFGYACSSVVVLGYTTVLHYLVLFVYNTYDSKLIIYRIEFGEDRGMGDYTNFWCILWQGQYPLDIANLSLPYLLATEVSYESDKICKVYFSSIEYNIPLSVINIFKVSQYSAASLSPASYELYDNTEFYNRDCSATYKDAPFNMVPELSLKEDVHISRVESSGIFAPGTIQYAFTYYFKYQQESNIAYTSGLYYISHVDRGASPEDTVSCAFSIDINNVDSRFDYIRIYSIQRTSLNGTPICKQIQDIELSRTTTSVHFVDNGTTGSIIDNSYLLYKTGQDLTVGCLKAKTGKLFMGNIKYNISQITQTSNLTNTISCKHRTVDLGKKTYLWDYNYVNQLFTNTQTFKSNQTYRLGIQLQYKTGEWSQPIWLQDLKQTMKPYLEDKLNLPDYETTLTQSFIQSLTPNYKKVRGVVVLPSAKDKEVLFQGMICPTVFNAKYREINTPFSQASWFIRPFNHNIDTQDRSQSNIAEFRHMAPLSHGLTRAAECQNMCFYEYTDGLVENTDYPLIRLGSVTGYMGKVDSKYQPAYFIDQSILTLNSPDITFDDNSYNVIKSMEDGYVIDLIGALEWNCDYGGVQIQTESSPISNKGLGIIPPEQSAFTQGGQLISGTWYNDAFVDDALEIGNDGKPVKDGQTVFNAELANNSGTLNWMTYLWHRNGSLNNDINRPEGKGNRSAKLKRKVVSNLQVSNSTKYFDEDYIIEPDDLEFFNSNEITMERLKDSHYEKQFDTYYGNIDQISMGTQPFRIAREGQYIENGTIRFKLDNNINTEQTFGCTLTYRNVDYNIYNITYIKQSFNGSSIILTLQNFRCDDLDFWKVLYKNDGTLPSDFDRYNPNRTYGGWKSWLAARAWADLGESAIITLSITNNQQGSGDYIINGSASIKSHKFYTGQEFTTFSVTGTLSPDLLTDDSQPIIDSTSNKLLYIDPSEWQEDGKTKQFIGDFYEDLKLSRDPVNIKYKSTPHIVFSTKYIDTGTDKSYRKPLPVLNELDKSNISANELYWLNPQYTEDEDITITSEVLNKPEVGDINNYSYIAEVVVNPATVVNQFGGTSKEALQTNQWIPAGEPVELDDTIKWIWGDTWYQKYDCLKTYSFTNEDVNSVIEIGSFMCETNTNIDGRYDRNRGLQDNTNVSPINFNLINTAYSQMNNFFTYTIYPDSFYQQNHYSSQIIYSLTHSPGALIDVWCNVNGAASLELDSKFEDITAIRSLNERLIAFQVKGISELLYNTQVQVSASNGVPIELANNNTLSGYRILDAHKGCACLYQSIETSSGIFFVDTYNRTVYNYTGSELGIVDIGNSIGELSIIGEVDRINDTMYTKSRINLLKSSITSDILYSGLVSWMLSYDSITQEIYLTSLWELPISLGGLVSSFTRNSQVMQPALINYIYSIPLNSWITKTSIQEQVFCVNGYIINLTTLGNSYIELYQLYREDRYGCFYKWMNRLYRLIRIENPDMAEDTTENIPEVFLNLNIIEPFSVSIILNENPQFTKIFNTIEIQGNRIIREDLDSSLSQVFITHRTNQLLVNQNTHTLHIGSPFDNIVADNEYQNSYIVPLDSHNMRKKFNIWRAQIPRNKCFGSERSTRDRMRNPWLRITLFNGYQYVDSRPASNQITYDEMTGEITSGIPKVNYSYPQITIQSIQGKYTV